MVDGFEIVAVRPRKPSSAEAIENCLSNPLNYLGLSLQATSWNEMREEVPVIAPDVFLVNFERILEQPTTCLNQLSQRLHVDGNELIEFDSRTRGRELVDELQRWVVREAIERKAIGRTPSNSLTVPLPVYEATGELAGIGRRLGMAWRELERSGMIGAGRLLFEAAKEEPSEEGPARPEKGLPADELNSLGPVSQRAQSAWKQYESAIQANGELEDKSDKEVYEWLREQSDLELPKFETWDRYVREARKALGLQKYGRGVGVTTRSVVSVKDLAYGDLRRES